MDLYEAIKIRRSVRKYKKDPIPPDKLYRIWEAARWAPSACNLQPWNFLVIGSSEKRKLLRGIIQDWALEAPLLVVALGNPQLAWQRDGESVHQIDVAIAVEHLIRHLLDLCLRQKTPLKGTKYPPGVGTGGCNTNRIL